MKNTEIETRLQHTPAFGHFKMRLTCDWMTGQGGRIGIASIKGNDCIDRYLSPRLKRSQLAIWLDGFQEALETLWSTEPCD